jgi:hypothetical protein
MDRSEMIWRVFGLVMAAVGFVWLLRPSIGARWGASWNRSLGRRAPWLYLKRDSRELEGDRNYQAITSERTWKHLVRWIAAIQVVVGLGLASGLLLPSSMRCDFLPERLSSLKRWACD